MNQCRTSFLQRALVILLGIFISCKCSALVTSYSFSQSAGTYTAITSGTVLGDTSNDDDNFAAQNIGFTFFFNGQAYTQFGVNANGYISFGNLASSHAVISANGNNNSNSISALCFDLAAQPGAELRYLTAGTAPNRTLTVQWKNYRTFNTTPVTGENLNFQIRISEGSNTVDIKYGTCTTTTSQFAQVGLRGMNNTDYSNRYDSVTVNTWATSTAGTSDTSTCMLSASFKPVSGQTYSWAPPAPPAAPITLTFTNTTPTGTTLHWVDNSTTETSFLVYKSADNITFTQAGTVASTTTAATGGAYSFSLSGLPSATQYYFRVYAMAITSSAALSGNTTTTTGTVCGTMAVGPTGAYHSISLALADLAANGLSCAVILELQPAYNSSVETFPIVVPYLGCTATNRLTLRPQAGASNLQIIGDSSRIFDLNGATYFTINGSAGGTGSAINLTIYDSLSTGNTIRFINDAQNNTIAYTNIRGATKGSTTNAVIQFANAATAAGNSNNSILYCDITKSDSLPQVLLYSNTTVGSNVANTISHTNFHDWFYSGGSNYAINLGANNGSWIISYNSFYQTSPQTYISGNNNIHAAINIAGAGGMGGGGASGSGFDINGNYIGGSAPYCSGSAWIINGSAGPRFNGILLNAGTNAISQINGNEIRNISLSTSAGGGMGGSTIFNAISISGGNVLGLSNQIGVVTGVNSIQTIASGNGATTVGINSSSAGNVLIDANMIGGINANDSSSASNTSLIGILASAGTLAITNNSIGSSTTANSLSNGAGTATTTNQVTGISITNVTSSNVNNNVIRNLSSLYRGAGIGTAKGISATGGSNSFSANVIENISNTSAQNGTGANASLSGISVSTNQGDQNISGNSVRLLINKSDSGNVVINGIYFSGSNAGINSVSKNNIYGLNATLDTAAAIINGIQINGGAATTSNNFVRLGSDTAGTSLTRTNEYNGILKSGNGNDNFYFNTVSISGTGVTTRATNTYAFRRTTAGTDTVRNNIFVNSRSNATAGGSHYSIAINNNATLVSGKNDLYGNGTGYVTGLFAATNENSLFNFFSTAGVDSNSVAIDPHFQSATNLHINNSIASPLESDGYVISGINTDIDNQVRPGPAGSVNGGGVAPDIGADEFDGSRVTIDIGVYALARPGNGCHTSSDTVSVTIKNYSSQTIDFSANNVTVNVSASGANPFTFPAVTITSGTLAAGATRTVIVSTTYNLSTAGTYVFNAYENTAGDIFTSNDTLAPVTINISGGIASPSLSNICAGLPVTLSVTGQTSGSSLQWQQSINHLTFTNINGATSSTVTVNPNVTTYYRVVSCGVYFSNIDTVNTVSVNPPTTTGATRCGNGSVTLHAAGSNNIVWFDSLNGGTAVDTGTSFTVNVTANRSYYAAANGNISAAKTLATPFNGTINNGGNMFTITALTNITVTGFDGHSAAAGDTNTWGIYFRRDNIDNIPGANTSSAGWIFVDSAVDVVAPAAGLPTPIPINLSVFIPAGSTYSFYVYVISGPGVLYSIGTGLGNVNASNADLQVKDGYGGPTFNVTGMPRIFNGVVHYNSSCLSNRVAANVTVTPPVGVTISSSSSTTCSGDSVHLTATSTDANYVYTWSSASTLNDSTGASVYEFPSSLSTYYLHANDPVSGCASLDSITVLAYELPGANINVNRDTICTGDTVQFSLNGNLSYAIGNGNTSSANYPNPYGNASFGARHQMLIRATEMQAAGMVPGYINSLSFIVTQVNGGGPLTNFTIKIGNTNRTNLTDTFQTGALTTVYTNASYQPVAGVNTHLFTAPFHWNGTSNILLEQCFNDTNATANPRIRISNTSFASCTYSDTNTANNCSRTNGTAVTQRPNIRFGIRNQFITRWISTEHLNDSLSATPYSVPVASAVFHVLVTDTITGCMNSDSIRIEVDPAPVVNLGSNGPVCGQILLDAGNPGDTYLWSDSSRNRTLLVDTSGTYSVRVTHAGSCSSSDTITVIVNVLPVVSLSLPFDTLCSNAPAVALSGGTPTNGTFTGAGIVGGSFDPAIASAGNHQIVYSFTDGVTGCSNSDSVRVTVSVCTGINTLDNSGAAIVFPNPFNKEFTLDLRSIKGNCKVELMTPAGVRVMNTEMKGSAVYPVNVSDFAAGIYYLRVTTASENYILRVVKN